MGLRELFSTLMRTDVTSNSNKINAKERKRINHLLLDFNSIIHVSSQTVISEINFFMKQVMKNLFLNRSLSSPEMIDSFNKYKMNDILKKINSMQDRQKSLNHAKNIA